MIRHNIKVLFTIAQYTGIPITKVCYFVTFFLFATVLRFPFLVRELFLVFCPLSGNPVLWRIPLYEPMSINLFIFSCVSERSSPSIVNLETSALILLISSSFHWFTFLFSSTLANVRTFLARLLPTP